MTLTKTDRRALAHAVNLAADMVKACEEGEDIREATKLYERQMHDRARKALRKLYLAATANDGGA